MASTPPRSLHLWKNKFFYIRKGVIPVRMSWRVAKTAPPEIPAINFEGTRWYLTLTAEPSRLDYIKEPALVAAGMSRIWGKTDRVPIFKVDGQGIYSNSMVILFCMLLYVSFLIFCFVHRGSVDWLSGFCTG